MPAAYVAGAGLLLGAYGSTQDGPETKSSGTSQGTSTQYKNSSLTLMDKLSKQQLDKLTGGLSDKVANQTAFDPTSATASAQGVVKSIFDAYQKTALPQIANMSNRGGSYDNTTHQLVENDAYAQAVNKASSTVLSTVQQAQHDKQQADQFDMTALLQTLGLQSQVTQKSKSKATEIDSGTTSGTSMTGGENWASALGGAMTSGAGMRA